MNTITNIALQPGSEVQPARPSTPAAPPAPGQTAPSRTELRDQIRDAVTAATDAARDASQNVRVENGRGGRQSIVLPDGKRSKSTATA